MLPTVSRRPTILAFVIGVVVVGLIAVALTWVLRASHSDPSTGTRRMAERLWKIADASDPESNPFLNSERVELFRRRLSLPHSPSEEVALRFLLAKELLLAGRSEEAIEAFETLQAAISQRRSSVHPRLLPVIQDWLAISYLRLGEQDNCVRHHGIDSCLLPIRDSGVHVEQRGSRAAIEIYEELLEANPEELALRWLLNLAYMTLGEHPAQVPAKWLIPPEAFATASDFKRFYDIAPQLNLDVMGLAGGAIIEDFNADGYLDLMASSWGIRDQLRFFHNNADGTFAERTAEAGLMGIVGGLNLCHADYNNDGFPDVLVLRGAWLGVAGRHPNSLLRNNGDGTFDDVTEQAGLLSFYPTQTASWGDYNNNNDGWLDLYIGNETTDGERHPCELYHNNGDGTFTECAADLGIDQAGFVKGVVWGDYDNDGWPDLYLSRWGEPNVLLRNEGPSDRGEVRPMGGVAPKPRQAAPIRSWSFRDVTSQAGVAEPLESFPVWFWDYDNDGWLDLFVSAYHELWIDDTAAEYLGLPFSAAMPKLYRNNGDGTFSDHASAAGLDRVLLPMGANFGDLDNDGFLDFYLGTGATDFGSLVPNRMFHNVDGRAFHDVTASGGFGHLQKGHGIAFGDLDNDGDQDIYAVMGGAFEGDGFHNALFHNPGHENHWITLKLEGVTSNRSALAARLRVRVNLRNTQRDVFTTVSTGGSFGSSSLQQEIGLGEAQSIEEIEVYWPASGLTQVFSNVAMDQIVTIREGDSTLKPVVVKRLDFSGVEDSQGQARHPRRVTAKAP